MGGEGKISVSLKPACPHKFQASQGYTHSETVLRKRKREKRGEEMGEGKRWEERGGNTDF